MPRVVDEVPNAWKPYMDGRIWEFTKEEYNAMPNWNPMQNTFGEICGMTRIQWVQADHVYVRFFDTGNGPVDPDKLAGWKP